MRGFFDGFDIATDDPVKPGTSEMHICGLIKISAEIATTATRLVHILTKTFPCYII